MNKVVPYLTGLYRAAPYRAALLSAPPVMLIFSIVYLDRCGFYSVDFVLRFYQFDVRRAVGCGKQR